MVGGHEFPPKCPPKGPKLFHAPVQQKPTASTGKQGTRCLALGFPNRKPPDPKKGDGERASEAQPAVVRLQSLAKLAYRVDGRVKTHENLGPQ